MTAPKNADQRAFDDLLEWVFEHGPIESGRIDPAAKSHPDFDYLLDNFQHAGGRFYDLSGLGRYHMTGEHAAIDEKPWRPKS